VEPDAHMLSQFQQRANIKNAQGEITKTNFHFFPETLENYEHNHGKVDLVLMIQSLYYIRCALDILYSSF
jgi:anti-anti-sigma regulatory factor